MTTALYQSQRPDGHPTNISFAVQSNLEQMSELCAPLYLPDVYWPTMTPAQAARALMSANPQASPALISVRSWTRSGRNGWGTATRLNRFVAVDGTANPMGYWSNRLLPRDLRILHNGHCQVCGQVFADYQLTWSTCTDPQAGQAAPQELRGHFHDDVEVVFGRAFVMVCAGCLRANGLEEFPSITDPVEWGWDFANADRGGCAPGDPSYKVALRRHHPALLRYRKAADAYEIRLDLTKGEEPVVEVRI